MQIQELLDEARETLGAKRVYGEPIVKNGLTVIPAAAVRGGGGGGVGHEADGEEGGGGGFGLAARPAGAWVIEGDKVEWKPALDLNRIIIGAELLAAAGIIRSLRPHTFRIELPRRLPKRLPKALRRRAFRALLLRRRSEPRAVVFARRAHVPFV